MAEHRKIGDKNLDDRKQCYPRVLNHNERKFWVLSDNIFLFVFEEKPVSMFKKKVKMNPGHQKL